MTEVALWEIAGGYIPLVVLHHIILCRSTQNQVATDGGDSTFIIVPSASFADIGKDIRLDIVVPTVEGYHTVLNGGDGIVLMEEIAHQSMSIVGTLPMFHEWIHAHKTLKHTITDHRISIHLTGQEGRRSLNGSCTRTGPIDGFHVCIHKTDILDGGTTKDFSEDAETVDLI